jgi:hypothetical protein
MQIREISGGFALKAITIESRGMERLDKTKESDLGFFNDEKVDFRMRAKNVILLERVHRKIWATHDDDDFGMAAFDSGGERPG